jgi:hypothetical protein
MSQNELMEAAKGAVNAARLARPASYTSKDFQLEVLGQLAEVQALTESLRETFLRETKLKEREESRLLRFDGRTLTAVGAIALSLTGYVLQDARNTSKRDAEIETMKARVARLEEISTTNSEARVRMEVELGELREGQAEIKELLEAHENTSQKAKPKK